MKLFKALSKLFNNFAKRNKKVVITENYSQPNNEIQVIENGEISILTDWAIEKIEQLHEEDCHDNANALAAEFDEWINIPEGTEELKYLCLENGDWTDENELGITT